MNIYGTVSRTHSRAGAGRHTVISVADGVKQCTECNATFSSSDVHSCSNYLARLLKSIVGETAFDRA